MSAPKGIRAMSEEDFYARLKELGKKKKNGEAIRENLAEFLLLPDHVDDWKIVRMARNAKVNKVGRERNLFINELGNLLNQPESNIFNKLDKVQLKADYSAEAPKRTEASQASQASRGVIAVLRCCIALLRLGCGVAVLRWGAKPVHRKAMQHRTCFARAVGGNAPQAKRCNTARALPPKQSKGSKARQGVISRPCNQYLRRQHQLANPA